MSDSGVHFRNRHTGGSEAGGVVTRETHGAVGFDPAVGGLPVGTARDGEQTQLPDLAPGAVDGSIVAPGALEGYHFVPRTLTRELFASTISVPEIVDALPVLPDADNYPQGSLVFLTTDGKLYRTTGGVSWTVEVDGNDLLAGSVVAGKVAAAAIGADEIAAGAIDTEHFQVTAKIPNVENADSSVVINPDGITITNGKLFLQDQYGATVMDAAGFGGAWLDFLYFGLYNGSFQQSALGVAWDVDLGISSPPPYWDLSGSALAEVVDETGLAPRGRAVKFTGRDSAALQIGIIRQSPITWVQGQATVVEFGLLHGGPAASGSALSVQIERYMADGSLLHNSSYIAPLDGLGVPLWNQVVVPGGADEGTAYVRLTLQLLLGDGQWAEVLYVRLVPGTLAASQLKAGTTGSLQSTLDSTGLEVVDTDDTVIAQLGRQGVLVQPSAAPFVAYRALLPNNGYTVLEAYDLTWGTTYPALALHAGWIELGSGKDPVDVVLNRTAAGVLSLTDGVLRITSATDLSLAEDNPPFMVGLPTGANIAMDANEIMARNNGAESSLHLQTDGGEVTVNQNGGSLNDGVRVWHGGIKLGTGVDPDTDIAIMFGADVQVARDAAGILKMTTGRTNAYLILESSVDPAFLIQRPGDGGYRGAFYVAGDGQAHLEFGSGVGARDVGLYRDAANSLRLAAGDRFTADRINDESTAWVAPTLGGGWVNYGGAFSTVGYRKDASGYVHLKGFVKSGSLDTTVFTFPAGYRPLSQSTFAVISNNAVGRVNVFSDGRVTISLPSNNAYVSLDSVIFYADN